MSNEKASRPGLAGGSSRRLASGQYIPIVGPCWPTCQVSNLPWLIRQARKHRRLTKGRQTIQERLSVLQRWREVET
jgi:hypothetical protein